MTDLSPPTTRKPTPGHVLRCETPADCSGILRPQFNLAIHPRTIPFAFVSKAAQDSGEAHFSFRLRVQTADDSELTKALSRLEQSFSPEEARWLQEDILFWTREFTALQPDVPVRVWLEEVTHDNCRAYHADFVTLRLLCTYRGPGTQWLDNETVAPLRDGRRLRGDTCCLQPQSLETGWVGLLKGERMEGNAGKGLVHRSPPLPEGKSRLLLRLDAGFRQSPSQRTQK